MKTGVLVRPRSCVKYWSGRVMIDIPTKVVAERLPYRRSAVAAVHGGVMLEAVSADDLQEFLEPLDLDDGFGSKGIERIVGELPVTDISTNLSGNVVSADPPEGDRACRGPALERSHRVLFSEHGAQNRRGSNSDIGKKILRPIAAVKEHAFVWVFSVIVVPVNQSGRATTGELKSVH